MSTTIRSLSDKLDDALYDSIVALGVREEGTITDLDTLIIDRRKAVSLILALIEKEKTAIAKAYGGCTKCYGKGYATICDGTIGYEDFGGDGFRTPITTKMKFCSCSRGEQLSAILKGGNK